VLEILKLERKEDIDIQHCFEEKTIATQSLRVIFPPLSTYSAQGTLQGP